MSSTVVLCSGRNAYNLGSFWYFVHSEPRKVLILQNPSTLTKEESWLRKVYINMVSKLMKRTLTVLPHFDPFSYKFCGLGSVQYNKHYYQALSEVTSYFWGSKGGRGSLLEKIMAVESGPNSAKGVLLAKIPQLIEDSKGIIVATSELTIMFCDVLELFVFISYQDYVAFTKA